MKKTLITFYLGYKFGIFADRYLKPAIGKALDDWHKEVKQAEKKVAEHKSRVAHHSITTDRQIKLAFETLKTAHEILYRLRNLADVYGQVTVTDLSNLLGTVTLFSEINTGWNKDDLADLRVTADNNFYILMLPKPGQL